jgi:hypothetical protein
VTDKDGSLMAYIRTHGASPAKSGGGRLSRLTLGGSAPTACYAASLTGEVAGSTSDDRQ